MALTIPEAEQVQAVLTARIHDLIGTDFRDAAEAAAVRAEAAAEQATTGVPDGAVTRPKLGPDVVAELEGKADKADVPVTDAGYSTHLAGDEPDKYPYGVSVAMSRGNDGWTNSILADVPDYETSTFVIVLTLRQSNYIRSTTQYVSSYDDDPRPIYTRKWTSNGWGPWRSLTDDGHTHDVSDVSGLGSALAGKSNTSHTHAIGDVTGLQAAIDEAAGAATWGELQGKPSTFPPSSHTHAFTDLTGVPVFATKGHVSTEIAKKADADHTHTAAQVGARPASWTPTASDVGARPDSWVPTAAQVGAATPAYVDARPAMWLWDGSGTWSAPAGAVVNDNVLNTATGEIWSIK